MIFIAFMIGGLAGFFIHGVISVDADVDYRRVWKAYDLLVTARDDVDYTLVEDAIGYLGQVLEG